MDRAASRLMMKTETRSANGESVGTWKRAVGTVCALNYVSSGFRGLQPRLSGVLQSLEDLGRLIPSIEQESTTEAIEAALRTQIMEIRELAGQITLVSELLDGLLLQLDQRRAHFR